MIFDKWNPSQSMMTAKVIIIGGYKTLRRAAVGKFWEA
jgi:hypothetical protein